MSFTVKQKGECQQCSQEFCEPSQVLLVSSQDMLICPDCAKDIEIVFEEIYVCNECGTEYDNEDDADKCCVDEENDTDENEAA